MNKHIKHNIKYFASFITLLIVFICIGNIVMAEEADEIIVNELNEEMEVINAEDIGIKEIEKTTIEKSVDTEACFEDKTMDEAVTHEEKVSVISTKNVEEISATEPVEKTEENAEVDEDDEKFEGYIDGVYFEPNCFGDCPLHDACYMCEEHDIKAEVFIDEEINPENGWVYLETCIVCGHCLASEPVDDTFVDAYYAK